MAEFPKKTGFLFLWNACYKVTRLI